MAKIVCVGLACLDYLFKVTTLPGGGGKFFADDYRAVPGGPAAAAGIAVAALGHEAIFIGRLGDDQVGHDLVNHMAAQNVDVTHVRHISGQSSQVSSVIIDQEGERQIINYSSSKLDPDPSWIPEEIISSADFLLTDVRWPKGAEHALKKARKHNIPSLIDADSSPIDVSYLVELATYSIFSERGLEMVSKERNIEKALRACQDKSEAWLAVTAGEKGSYWLEGSQLKSCPAEKITPIDTCGAGDVFHGAFAVAMAEKMKVAEAMHFAGITAALKCLTFGGSLGVPDRTEVERYLARS